MKILLLGAAGFIGTNLTIELAKKTEDEITLVDLIKIQLITLLSHMIWQHLLIPVRDNRGYLTLVYVQ